MVAFTPSSKAGARSVQGATEGFCDATTSTTKESVDLTTYAGRIVKIYSEGADHHIFFDADGTTTLLLTAQSLGTAGVPDRVDQGGEGAQRVVPRGLTFLNYAAVSGTGLIRVLPL